MFIRVTISLGVLFIGVAIHRGLLFIEKKIILMASHDQQWYMDTGATSHLSSHTVRHDNAFPSRPTLRKNNGLHAPATRFTDQLSIGLCLPSAEVALNGSSSTSLKCNRITLRNHANYAMTGPTEYVLGISLPRDPVDTEKKLGPEGSLATDPTLYRNLAEALHYLTFTRPNLSNVVQYYFGLLHHSLLPTLMLTGLVIRLRADLLLDTVFFLVTTSLTLSSKTPGHVVRSKVAAAEYRGVANVVAETSWIRNLLL
ncbi:ribonuclease H-like domain-containing protein [Tanacetum coccineum]